MANGAQGAHVTQPGSTDASPPSDPPDSGGFLSVPRVPPIRTSERPFLIFDALGFCTALKTQSLTNVYLRLQSLAATAAGSAGMSSQPLPEIACVSDTIFVLAPVDVPVGEALRRLAEYACVLLANAIVIERFAFPLRGTLGFGEVMADMKHTWQFDLRRDGAREGQGAMTRRVIGPVLIGGAVVEAMAWEKMQKWIGASIEPNQLLHLRSEMGTVMDDLVKNHSLLEWDVPTAHGLVRTLALNFVPKSHQSRTDYLLQELRKGEDQAPNLEVRAKYIATRLFAEQVIQDGTYNPT